MFARRAVITGLAAILCLAVVAAGAIAEEYLVDVQVSPSVLYLDSQGTKVSLHVGVAFADVSDYTVTIHNEDEAYAFTPIYDFADCNGDLVIKLKRADIKSVISNGWWVVSVAGTLGDGEDTFLAETDWRVRKRMIDPNQRRQRKSQ